MSVKMYENGYQTTMICIDSYDNSIPVGRFYSQHTAEGTRFYGAIDLIKKMEVMLDELGYPQSFSRVRSFTKKPVVDMVSPAEDINDKGKVATFITNVMFRQHASWQGRVIWQEGECEKVFRSVMEFMFLIDSAISSKTA